MTGIDRTSGNGDTTLLDSAPEAHVRDALIRQQYSQAKTGMYAAVPGAIVLTALVWEVIPHHIAIGWLVVFLAVQVPRHVLLFRYAKRRPTDAEIEAWGTWFLVGSAATATVWGASGIVLFTSESFMHQVLLALVLIGVAASCAVAHAPLTECYVSSVVLTLTPFLFRLVLQGDWHSLLLAAAGLAFLVAILGTGRAVHAMLRDTMRLRLEKDSLVTALRRAQGSLETRVEQRTAELAKKNSELLVEIEERHRAEETLQQEKERFETLARHLPLGLVTISREGRFQYANEKLLDMFGYDREEIPDGRRWFRKAFPDPEYRHQVVSFWKSDLASAGPGEQRPREFNVTRKDGTQRAILFRSVQLETGENIVTCEDVTDRRELEAERDRLFNLSLDMLCVAGFDGFFKQLNPAWQKTLGWSEEEICAKRWIEFVHPDDRESTVEAGERLMRGEPVHDFSNRYLCKDGTYRWLSWSSFPLIEDRLIFAVVRDITKQKTADEELRASEIKYRTILETIADGYHEADIAGNLTLVNDSFCDIAGCSREELIGLDYRHLMDASNAKRVYEAYNAVYRTGVPDPGLEFEIIRKDGARRHVSTSISAIRGSGGEVTGFRGIMRDNTEVRHLEDQLRHAVKMEAIGRLAGGVAHDFNNLLTAIIGYSDLLVKELPADAPPVERVFGIRNAAQRAAGLTQQLLAFSRKQVLDVRVIDLNELIAGLEGMLRRVIDEDVELISVYTPSLGFVRADPGRLEQVLVNLAVNSRDAMRGGGKLTIETKNVVLDEKYAAIHAEVLPGPYVMIAVSDDGTGIEPELLPRVFDPFFTTKEQGEGTGLGLSTVYGIVKQHSGHVAVYSEKGKGTTFKVYLPQVEGGVEHRIEPAAETSVPGGIETILVVEDEDTVRNLMTEVLEALGYDVLSVGSPDEAITVSADCSKPIHLLLTDVVLPGMDGRRLYANLSTSLPDMKVLYVSGYTENFIVHRGVLEPGIHFLQKPFNVEDLARKVREALKA